MSDRTTAATTARLKKMKEKKRKNKERYSKFLGKNNFNRNARDDCKAMQYIQPLPEYDSDTNKQYCKTRGQKRNLKQIDGSSKNVSINCDDNTTDNRNVDGDWFMDEIYENYISDIDCEGTGLDVEENVCETYLVDDEYYQTDPIENKKKLYANLNTNCDDDHSNLCSGKFSMWHMDTLQNILANIKMYKCNCKGNTGFNLIDINSRWNEGLCESYDLRCNGCNKLLMSIQMSNLI
eukprot:60319_1